MPIEWLPPGRMHRLSCRTIDPRIAKRTKNTTLAERHDEAIRRALLALWLPGLTQNGYRRLAESTWIVYSQALINIARWQIENNPSRNGSVFETLTHSKVVSDMFPALAVSKSSRRKFFAVIERLIDAGNRGVISDWPKDYETAQTPSQQQTVEDLVVGAPEIQLIETKPEANWPPFSDEFTTHFFRRAIWIIENIAEDVYQLWLQLRLLPEQLGKMVCEVSPIRARALSEFDWTDRDGHTINKLPFQLHYYDGVTDEWPPRDMESFNRIVSLTQSAIVSFVALCTGARSSELLSAEDTELQLTNGRFHSRIWKFASHRGGKPFDWPLHPIAVLGVQIQQILSRALRPQNTKHLWVLLRVGERAGMPTQDLSVALATSVDFLGLSELAGSKRPHIHRFRPTLARLVALAVTSAPQVLQDVFDHNDVEHTLTYICSDPEIVETALKVAEELSYVMASDAIKDVLSGEASGPASGRIKSGLNTLAMRRGETEFSTTDLRETIQMLTFNGRTFQLVRPGVLCTKADGEYGPCTKGRGSPDPGSCRTFCNHRLETARAKRECGETVRWLVNERTHAINAGEVMLVARLDGEICAHLERWEDVRTETLSSHPELFPIWDRHNKQASSEKTASRNAKT